MNKIRLFFLIVISVVSLVSLFLFITLHRSPKDMQIEKVSEFKITQISGNGKIYYSYRPFDEEELTKSSSGLKVVDVKQLKYDQEMYIRSDEHTSFEFFCFDTSFIILPSSYLQYYPKTKTLRFLQGEFLWRKEVKKRKLDISIKESQYLLTTSEHGRIKVGENSLEIWNFAENMKFHFNGEDYLIKKNQLFSVAIPQQGRNNRTRPPAITDVLPPPETIEPADQSIPLTDEDKSVVKFEWRTVRGKPRYKFKLYSSPLKESVLEERSLSTNNTLLDLLEFEERDFYWEVYPVDQATQLEGVPSKLGHVKLVGSLTEKKNVKRKPELQIESVTATGNMAFVKGKAETTATLYIDDDKVTVDRDGSFFHTIQYDSIGVKKIIIRLVSPLNVVNEIEKSIQIYAE